MADLNAFNARQKYSHFRILVIGRANAGKTSGKLQTWGSLSTVAYNAPTVK